MSAFNGNFYYVSFQWWWRCERAIINSPRISRILCYAICEANKGLHRLYNTVCIMYEYFELVKWLLSTKNDNIQRIISDWIYNVMLLNKNNQNRNVLTTMIRREATAEKKNQNSKKCTQLQNEQARMLFFITILPDIHALLQVSLLSTWCFDKLLSFFVQYFCHSYDNTASHRTPFL